MHCRHILNGRATCSTILGSVSEKKALELGTRLKDKFREGAGNIIFFLLPRKSPNKNAFTVNYCEIGYFTSSETEN